MVIPKRHVVSLSELTPDEKKSYVDVVGAYDDNGYSVYARAPKNIIKSVVHHHTHLLRLGHKRSKFILFLDKPLINITR